MRESYGTNLHSSPLCFTQMKNATYSPPYSYRVYTNGASINTRPQINCRLVDSNPLKWVEGLLPGFPVRFNGLILLARNSFAGGLKAEVQSLIPLVYTQ